MAELNNNTIKLLDLPSGTKEFRFLYFTQILKLPVCAGKIRNKIGKVTDLVFSLNETFPEAVGIFVGPRWGNPNQFIPWDKVLKIEEDAVFVAPRENNTLYPTFVDQKGWILINEHLMGRTVLDIDGRRIELVNDVHLLETKDKLLIVHVDISFNGFLRKLGLKNIKWVKDQFITWKYVQPLSLEDTGSKDMVTLSVTKAQMTDLPSEDLADVLEELSGAEQQAVFQELDSEKAAETLMEAEPRAQRQLITNLRKERAQKIMNEMSVPQLTNLFAVLPNSDVIDLMKLLPKDTAEKIKQILSESEETARALMTTQFISFKKDQTVGEVLKKLKGTDYDKTALSYFYTTEEGENTLVGVVDVRELVITNDEVKLEEIMISPVVSVEEEELKEELEDMFEKYDYKMLPVVDFKNRLIGVVDQNDVMTE